MSWLILQNYWKFNSLRKAGSVLCKIGRVKSNYCCCEVWTEEINTKHDDGYPVSLFLFAGGWKTHYCNYRNYVNQCPVSTLDWQSNFPHSPSKSLWSGDQTVITCGVCGVAIEVYMNTIPWRLCLLPALPCWWIMVVTAKLACTCLVTVQL